MTDRTEESGRSATQAGAESPAAASPVAHLSPAERAARGKAARSEVPRASHAEWEPSSARPDPIGLLEQQAQTRVPELVPIRYGRMLVSPFTFYRGAALIMASDLAATPRAGVERAALRRCASLELRDLRHARAEHDVRHQRLRRDPSRSVGVGRQAPRREPRGRRPRPRLLGQAARRGRPGRRRARTGRRCANSPPRRTSRSGTRTSMSRRRLRSTRASSAPRRSRRPTPPSRRRARRTALQAFAKLTHLVDGEPRIISDPPLIVPIEELFEGRDWQDLEQELRALFRDYRRTLTTDRRRLLEQYDLAHIARKVVGVGSVGTRAWIALFLGRDDGDPLFLQVKEAEASVLEPFLGRSEYSNCGQRVVAGQRLMQSASDMFLGWKRVTTGQPRRPTARLLRPPAARLEGQRRHRDDEAGRNGRLRPPLRLDARPRPRPLRRPDRDRLLPGRRRRLRQGDRRRSPRPTPTRTNATTRHSSKR